MADGRSLLEIPILPVRDAVLFPHAILPLTIGRASSIRLVESLDNSHKTVAVVAQREANEADPDVNALYAIGAAGQILHKARAPGDPPSWIVVTQGQARVRLLEATQRAPYLRARLLVLDDVVPQHPDAEYTALQDNVRNLFYEVVRASPTLSNELVALVANVTDAGTLSDFVASSLPGLSTATRQELLEQLDVRVRLQRLLELLMRERENQKLQEKIRNTVQQKIAGTQRDFFLREQLKAIQRELGDSAVEGNGDLSELRKRIDQAGLPDEAMKVAVRELERLREIPSASAEYTVARTYLEWVVALPWARETAEPVDVRRAGVILDEDHWDLEKIKERILEFLAVLQLKPDQKGPILCFIGPPGVGKTSLGRSIARALGRKFVRVSLGGMHDEAEIRGHRRTYIGALPGQVIQGLRRVETRDPVFMLDEVDKLGRDFRGDPASALMEVLDPEQNSTFRDHYLDIPFDLSHVLFIATANVLETIPAPLLDRMEVLELAGYSEEEKLHIAQRYLVPRQVTSHGLLESELTFTEAAIREMISGYTREAGVRGLERTIGAICRKQAREAAAGGDRAALVTPDLVRARLGVPRFHIETEVEERTRRPGVSVGLAWTPHGGEVLFVEAMRVPRDRGEFLLTGQLGQVMQESARAALSWLRANAKAQGIEPNVFREYDVHVHVPAGAVPKDGPSAGVAMVAALASLFLDRPVRPRIAVTGEITLGGQVLPVGGIKEKVLAARQSGIRQVVLPERNRADVEEELSPELRESLEFHFARTIEDVLAFVIS